MINPKELETDDLYFADNNYMSVSKYKRFKQCELMGMIDFGTPSEDMKIGQYVDSYVSGTLDKFIEDNPDIISSRGKTKGKLKVGFQKAQEICDFIDNDKTFKQFMQGDKQTVMTGEINGVPFKSKFDIYAKGITINDLKVMRTITDRNGDYYDFISQWGYEIQGAIYQEMCYQNTGEKLPFFICVVTKESPINSAIIQIPQDILDSTLELVKADIEHYYKVYTNQEPVNGCGKCKHCIGNRVTTPLISMDELIKGGIYDGEV